MGISLESMFKKGSGFISTARDKLSVGLRSAKSKEAYNEVRDKAPHNRPHISSINTSKDGNLFITAHTLPHTPNITIPKNLTAEGLKKFLDDTNEKLEQIKNGNSNLYVSTNGIIKENKPKGNQILHFNFDTSQPPIQNPSLEKADFLKDNNIQKSKDRLGRTRFSFKATINGTEHKLSIPKEFHSRPEAILASKERIEAFLEKIENNSPEAKDAYIKNGKIFKKSLEEVYRTYQPNGIESDSVTEASKEWIDKQVK